VSTISIRKYAPKKYLAENGALAGLLLLALVIAGVVIVVVGSNPFEAYWALLRGMFGSADRINASLGRSTPFIGAALAVAFAFRAGLFNIGAEGQLLVGATAAAWVGTFSVLADVPGPIAIPLIILAGRVRGPGRPA